MYPTIDAHFWIVRDGEIIDNDFPEYDLIRKIHGCEPETKVYKEAPDKTQEIMIEIFKEDTLHLFKCKKWETAIKQIMFITKLAGISKPQFNHCFQNSIIEQYCNGGELRFGSMGFKKTNGDTWWEYGGEDYKTIRQFRKKS